MRSWLTPGGWAAVITDPDRLAETAHRLEFAGFDMAECLIHLSGPFVIMARAPGKPKPLTVDVGHGRYPANVLAESPVFPGVTVVEPDRLAGWLARLVAGPGAVVVDPLGRVPGTTLDALAAGRRPCVVVSESRKLSVLGFFLLTLSGSGLG